MAQSDTIGDFITIIRNASRAKKQTAECASSRLRTNICEILKKEGFIKDFRTIKDKKQGVVRVYLKYDKSKEKLPAITNLKRISRPGLRVYKQTSELPVVLGGRGIALISTSKGILTDNECRDQKSGGEVLCYVW